MITLKRVSEQPILTPRKENNWEKAAVFNCAAIYDGGKVHMIYRATDITSNGSQGRYINSFGYAVSEDGMHFTRRDEPIMVNNIPQEARGPEDPRIVKMGDAFLMMYTGYGGRFPGDYRISLATSTDLLNWERKGVMLDEANKDASLFPEKVGGKYIMFHRRPPDIWLATSDDLKTWNDHQCVMEALPGSDWENEKIGIGGPPIKTDEGWLLIYHGVSKQKQYSLGIALLDLDNPSKVLKRQAEPILVPELDWEMNGYVPNVVFSCGQVIMGDELLVYYGGADTAIGVAKINMKDIIFEA